ncbi:MAG: hypothetical protein JOZ69_14835 [Myxococcales bacterium]|nr:hypothetical protein [Myxococcales bacterium]
MRATALLLRQRDRVRRIIGEIDRNKPTRDGRAVELIEEVNVLVSLEQAALQLFECTESDVHRQGFAHHRARALLFRLATADAANLPAIAQALHELGEVFAARSDWLRERVAAALDDATLYRVGRRLEALASPAVPLAFAEHP